MPLVRITLNQGRDAEAIRAIADGVHQAMTETLNVPALDRFQIITEHPLDSIVYNPTYLDIERTDEIVLIQITLNAGRTVEMKKAFYARCASLLAENARMRTQDVLISLVEVAKENWSFGDGIAQYA